MMVRITGYGSLVCLAAAIGVDFGIAPALIALAVGLLLAFMIEALS